jgi:hypothetical protein
MYQLLKILEILSAVAGMVLRKKHRGSRHKQHGAPPDGETPSTNWEEIPYNFREVNYPVETRPRRRSLRSKDVSGYKPPKSGDETLNDKEEK